MPRVQYHPPYEVVAENRLLRLETYPDMTESAPNRPLNFIEEIIETDRAAGKWAGRVQTRFPPEPNGYLHIGHAKSICLNFGLAEKYVGECNLRFDDTNPVKEEQEYVDAIVRDVRWLGFRWSGADDAPQTGVLFASDYFQQMYDYAVQLIRAGKAYVDDLTPEQIREHRGTLTTPGQNSPHRDRSVEENLELFEKMARGAFPDGSRTLRAKIDMAAPNLNLRDPIMYRILHADHHRTADRWCIYPMYDWAHGLEDSIEGITHSICTLEFENHRPLYDWFLDQLTTPDGKPIHHPQQIEFARLNLNYTVMSKRKLLTLVQERQVAGWDDPRMPTLSGMRRRGYTPEAIRDFCARVGVAKFDGVNEIALLEHCLREDLNKRAPRVMCVLNPLRVVITNWEDHNDADHVDWLTAINNPEDATAGERQVPFSRELFIERDDFLEDPPRKFFRLAPGREVRLRYGYFITCHEMIKDDTGQVVELRCTYDPQTRGGDAPDGRKVKGTLHWVSAAQAVPVEVRLYDHLFNTPTPDNLTPDQEADGADFRVNLNPESLNVLKDSLLEPNWGDAARSTDWSDAIPRVQFERQGYFCLDEDARHWSRERAAQAFEAASSGQTPLIFNRTVTLRDSWAKIAKKGS